MGIFRYEIKQRFLDYLCTMIGKNIRIGITGLLMLSDFGAFQCIVAQHFTVQDFSRSTSVLKHADDTVFIVETGYPATGILMNIPETETFTRSFLVVNQDTLTFSEGEEDSAEGNRKFSNLLTFSLPIQSFRFYPGPIQGEIQFYYINAQKNVEGPAVKPSKKKRFRLCRTRHD